MTQSLYISSSSLPKGGKFYLWIRSIKVGVYLCRTNQIANDRYVV